MAMDLRLEKYSLVERILNLNDASIIDELKVLLDRRVGKDIGRISIEQYNRELEEAELDYEENGGVDIDEVRKKIFAR
jgi:hypothetical protein